MVKRRRDRSLDVGGGERLGLNGMMVLEGKCEGINT